MNYNALVRHETCNCCTIQIPVFEYALSTYGDQGYIRLLKDGEVIALCTRCWNNNVNSNIQFGPRGWEWFADLRRGTEEWFEARHAADDAREVQS